MTVPLDKKVLGTTLANYSMGLVAPPGSLVFLSGQVALDPDGNLVGVGDCERQCRQTFENIRALLEEVGGSMQNVVKISTFITDMRYFDAFDTVRNEFFFGSVSNKHHCGGQCARGTRTSNRNRSRGCNLINDKHVQLGVVTLHCETLNGVEGKINGRD